MDQNEPITKPKISWRKILTTLGIIIISSGIAGGFTYYFMVQEIVKNKENSLELQNQINEFNKKNSNAPTANWKPAKLFDINFKLNPEWKYNEKSVSVGMDADIATNSEVKYDGLNTLHDSPDDPHYSDVRIFLKKHTYDSTNLESAVTKLANIGQGWSTANKESVTVNNLPAFKYDKAGCCSAPFQNRVFFLANDNMYEITVWSGNPDLLEGFKTTFEVFLETITF